MSNKENQDTVELFDEESTITLYDDENNPIEFFEIASIEYEEKFYELLQPVEPIEGLGEDEAVIFEYTVEEGTEEKLFKPIFDEELLNNVFTEYLKAVSAGDSGCGGGCGSCGHGCGGHSHDDDGCDCGDDDCGCEHK